MSDPHNKVYSWAAAMDRCDELLARAEKVEAGLAETESALRALSDELERAEEQRGEAEARATRLLAEWEKAEARLVLAEKARRAEQVRANKAEAERDNALIRAEHERLARENGVQFIEAWRREADTLREALAAVLDCRGSYNGTVSERGGDPAICTKCEEIARAALTRGAGDE